MVQRFLILLIGLLMTFTTIAQKRDTIAEITFASMFELDTISVNIEGCFVANSVLLNTDLSDGVTDFQLFICDNEANGTVVVDLEGRETKCEKSLNQYFTIEVSLNEEVYVYDLELNKGKYIVFNKSKDSLSYKQFNYRPVFN